MCWTNFIHTQYKYVCTASHRRTVRFCYDKIFCIFHSINWRHQFSMVHISIYEIQFYAPWYEVWYDDVSLKQTSKKTHGINSAAYYLWYSVEFIELRKCHASLCVSILTFNVAIASTYFQSFFFFSELQEKMWTTQCST